MLPCSGTAGACCFVALFFAASRAKTDHDFRDPDASHREAAISFDEEGDLENSLRAFEAAARFNPDWTSLSDLGVCKMKHNRIEEAEEHLLEAARSANTPQAKKHVESNLNVLEQHMAFRRGEKVHGGLEYRRRDSRHRPQGQSSSSQPSAARSGKGVKRSKLVHQRPDWKKGQPFKRVTKAMLDEDYERLRKRPYILTDGMDDWPLSSEWNRTWRERFVELFPQAVADFYPYNMLLSGRQSPYLTRLPKAIQELEVPEEDFHFGSSSGGNQLEGRYLHFQLDPTMWRHLEGDGDLPANRHASLHNDEWFRTCMDEDVSAEWHLKTHWKIILIGSRGAGMFQHSDSLLTSSWHAHVTGEKWWYVCGTLANGSSTCFEEVVRPGDILYYPPSWSHETQCLETPTMTLTDTVAHEGNAEGILGKTLGECTGRDPLRFDFSAKLCDALDACTSFWQSRVQTEWSNTEVPSWRTQAIAGEIAKKEQVKPSDNNYDGRNYITE